MLARLMATLLLHPLPRLEASERLSAAGIGIGGKKEKPVNKARRSTKAATGKYLHHVEDAEDLDSEED